LVPCLGSWLGTQRHAAPCLCCLQGHPELAQHPALGTHPLLCPGLSAGCNAAQGAAAAWVARPKVPWGLTDELLPPSSAHPPHCSPPDGWEHHLATPLLPGLLPAPGKAAPRHHPVPRGSRTRRAGWELGCGRWRRGARALRSPCGDRTRCTGRAERTGG